MRKKCLIKDCMAGARPKFGLCDEHSRTGLDPIALARPRQARRKAQERRNVNRIARHAPRS